MKRGDPRVSSKAQPGVRASGRVGASPALDLEERARSPLALSATNRHCRRHATCNTNEPHVLCVFTSFLARVDAFWRSVRVGAL